MKIKTNVPAFLAEGQLTDDPGVVYDARASQPLTPSPELQRYYDLADRRAAAAADARREAAARAAGTFPSPRRWRLNIDPRVAAIAIAIAFFLGILLWVGTAMAHAAMKLAAF